MISAFNSVYTALRGFFSQGFWFANFLPVALFFALHLLVAVAVLGSLSLAGITVSFQGVIGDTTTAAPAIIVGLIVLAYALQPLMPHFRGLLDGSQLPAWLHQWVRPQRLAFARATRRSIKAAFDDLGALNDLRTDVHADNGTLRTDYRLALRQPDATNEAVLTAARTALQALQDALSATAPLMPKATAAQDAVLAALAANSPDADAMRANGRPADEFDRAAATNEVADDLEESISEAAREADYRYNILRTRNRVVEALDSPRATWVGDARFVVEAYSKAVYDVEFEFLWPRLLAAIRAEKADDPMLTAIDAARAQADFAVLSVFLAASVPVVWLPVILSRGGPAWLFLVIGAATPPVLGFFYRLVFEAQLAFDHIVKTAVDRSRFLVLKMLRQPEPLSRSAERRLWAQIRDSAEDVRAADLAYVPQPAATPAASAAK